MYEGGIYMVQEQIRDTKDFHALSEYLCRQRVHRIFLVCGGSFDRLPIAAFFERLPREMGIDLMRFSDFAPNPAYESVERGVSAFLEFKGDLIAAIGGGSAIDVAKCIKLYSNMDPKKNYLEQEIIPNHIPFLAVPTTAGTGSEATQFAVIYYQGNKQSISHPSGLPTAVLLSPAMLRSLPLYQKKVTMMDALCHGIESAWSKNSTSESMEYALRAIEIIVSEMGEYLEGSENAAASVLLAANLAGKAINITQTTAAHAMCYKLTTLYGLPHGHSVALCLPHLWRYMLGHMEDCTDQRGEAFLQTVFEKIAAALGCGEIIQAIVKLENMLEALEIKPPKQWSQSDVELLTRSVNPIRMRNNPVQLDESAFRKLYLDILKGT